MEDLKYERLRRDLLMAREQQEKLKLKAIEERERRKEAEQTSKHVCKQNSELRSEINKHVQEQSKRDKLVDKMKSKYQKLTKQTQVNIPPRPLFSLFNCALEKSNPHDHHKGCCYTTFPSIHRNITFES